MASETKLERRYARRRVSEGKRARKSLARGAEHGIKERGQGSRWERRTDTAAVAGEADPIGASEIPEWATEGGDRRFPNGAHQGPTGRPCAIAGKSALASPGVRVCMTWSFVT